MSYGRDLRCRVVKFVQHGGGQSEAARVFGVSLGTVKNWMRAGLAGKPSKPGRRTGQGDKLNRAALENALKRKPDLMLKELASMFGVSINAVFHACKTQGLVRKKNGGLRRSKAL
jgi:transposase